MTSKLKWFFFFGIVWSAVFYVALNWAITQTDVWWSVLFALAYGFGFYIAGSRLGGAEKKPKPKMLGDYYALSAMITSLVGALVWVVWWQPDQMNFVIYLAIAYFISLLIMLLITNSKKK